LKRDEEVTEGLGAFAKKEVREMNNKILTAMFIVLCLAIGYAPLQAGEVSGKSLPVITAAFASKELIPGHTWKVYLKASDPDGDMQYIVSVVYQPGWGDYPVSRTRIREENGKELDGYIYLNTLVIGGYEFEDFFTYTLTVQVQDKAGHYSKPVEFSVTFNHRAVQEPPPAGVFKEQALGPILVNLHPFQGGSGGGHQ
jgi:6,7-dimethyl-8-ribityllumazine synthase